MSKYQLEYEIDLKIRRLRGIAQAISYSTSAIKNLKENISYIPSETQQMIKRRPDKKNDIVRWQKELTNDYENLISFHESRLISLKKEEEAQQEATTIIFSRLL